MWLFVQCSSGEGSIYQSSKATRDIASALVQALGDTPLVIKVGTYEDSNTMQQVFRAASESKVAAICGINSVSMKVIEPGKFNLEEEKPHKNRHKAACFRTNQVFLQTKEIKQGKIK